MPECTVCRRHVPRDRWDAHTDQHAKPFDHYVAELRSMPYEARAERLYQDMQRALHPGADEEAADTEGE